MARPTMIEPPPMEATPISWLPMRAFPPKYYGLDKPGMHVGVVGLGGRGHIAVKFAKALGAKVTVISTSPNRKDEAIQRLGATLSWSAAALFFPFWLAAFGTMDGIIFPLLSLIGLLTTNGKLTTVGAPEKPLERPIFPLLSGRKIVGESVMRGIKGTQEMIDFAAKHNIKADIEVIPMDYMNTAMDHLLKADIRYRFVIDIANTLKAA
ncbi:hypothetical protein RJ641_010023 [Dillenia turbinata]|uniref:Alcohol dehydrogenase-like C-terminal domain-containing protein n=1 Tax=Dillenia turbinata TaxID=194707 RepID=A0AAN8Z7X4_9MAGN